MGADTTQQSDDDPLSRAAKLEAWAVSFSEVLLTFVRVVAFICALLAWLVFGFIAWLGTLIIGIPVMIVITILALFGGFRVDGIARKFQDVLRFFPQGLVSITQGFWTQSHSESEDLHPAHASYTFGFLKILYVAAMTYVVYAVWNKENFLAKFMELPQFAVIGAISVIIMTALLCAISDWRNESMMKSGKPNTASDDTVSSAAEP